MRAALHGLAIYINNALTQPICVSCYSDSGSDLALVQAHQTQRSYNRVHLAQSHSSLATGMKRRSRASILLHKNGREVQFKESVSTVCWPWFLQQQKKTARDQQTAANKHFPVRSAGTSAAKPAAEPTPGVSLAFPKTTGCFRGQW